MVWSMSKSTKNRLPRWTLAPVIMVSQVGQPKGAVELPPASMRSSTTRRLRQQPAHAARAGRVGIGRQRLRDALDRPDAADVGQRHQQRELLLAEAQRPHQLAFA